MKIVEDKNLPLVCSGHSRPISYIEHSRATSNGSIYLLSSCKDGTAQMRNAKTGDWIGTFNGHKGALWSSKFNKDVTMVATAAADYTAKLWDCITGEEKATFTHGKIVKDIAFSPEENRLVSGGFEKQLRVWDLESYDSQPEIFPEQTTWIRHTVWNNLQPFMIISSGDDNHLRLWDVRSKELIRTIELEDNVTSLSISKDFNFITTTSGTKVKFWNAAKMEILKEYDVKLPVNSASINPAADRFAVGSADFGVYVFSIQTGEKLETFRGHHGPVHSVSFSPDGATYASGSEDGTIRIWLDDKTKPYELWQFADFKQ